MLDLRAKHSRSNPFERPRDSRRVTRELDRRGVGQILPLPRDGSLNESAHQRAQESQDHHPQANQNQVDRPAVLRVSATAPAIRGDAKHNLPDQSQQQDAVQDADQPNVQSHVAVEDVAEFVGDDPLQLVAGELLDRPPSDGHHRVAGRIASGKRVDALFIGQQIDRRYGHARGQRHFLHDVQNAFFYRVAGVGVNPPAADRLGHGRPPATERGHLVQTPQHDQRQRRSAGGERNSYQLPYILRLGSVVGRQDDRRRHGRHRPHDAHHGQHKHRHQPLGRAARLTLTLKKIGSHG